MAAAGGSSLQAHSLILAAEVLVSYMIMALMMNQINQIPHCPVFTAEFTFTITMHTESACIRMGWNTDVWLMIPVGARYHDVTG